MSTPPAETDLEHAVIESFIDRPQPIGVFPLPAGNLVVRRHADAEGDTDEIRACLLAGRLPESFPGILSFYQHALNGDEAAALAALGSADDIASVINRFVLSADPALLKTLRLRVTPDARPDLALHIETVAYTLGLSDSPPAIPEGAAGPVAAMAKAAAAADALSRHDTAAAADLLEDAAQLADEVSPALAGQLLGQLANVQVDAGGAKRAVVTFEAALDKLTETDLALSRGELHTACGAAYQEMSESAPRLMQNAINHYHQALALITRDTAPDVFAIANANLGLAYLMMPMVEASDQLRMGVAVQSLRDALTVFTPATHLDRWSSTQLNLANALVYLPSRHQADNIAEAVGLYEGVLAHRDRDRDPQGRARVLANQGNALAHLGQFGDAKVRLVEARSIFAEFDEVESMAAVSSVLDEIAKHTVPSSGQPA